METISQNINSSIYQELNKDVHPQKNLIFKIVILGDSGVGKTSILHYFVFNKCN